MAEQSREGGTYRVSIFIKKLVNSFLINRVLYTYISRPLYRVYGGGAVKQASYLIPHKMQAYAEGVRERESYRMCASETETAD